MKLIKDFLPVLRSNTITFLKSHQESNDVISFEFEKPGEITWKAGQHGVFMFSRTHIKGLPFRGFSIASSPQENTLRIATRIRAIPSDFKTHLLGLDSGDGMRIRGPFGPFYLCENDVPVVFIAGGIGITPFLGLLRDFRLGSNMRPRSVHLIYSTPAESPHAFKDEIEDIRSQLAFVDAAYVSDRNELLKELDCLAAKMKNQGLYYISGPGNMIQGIRRCLRRKHISSRNIHTDWFLGY